jgi:predicted HicB family RNase H-like nuclease
MMLTYKGYTGHVEFDEEAGLFHGEILDTRDVVTFQGTSVEDLIQAFHDSIDDYLDYCKERGEQPDKPFSGRLMLRVSPDLHRQVSVKATRAGKSLNQWIVDKLREAS